MKSGVRQGTDATSNVRGPFIEYDCVRCGTTVQEVAPDDSERLNDRIAELKEAPGKRLCAPCWHPSR